MIDPKTGEWVCFECRERAATFEEIAHDALTHGAIDELVADLERQGL